MLRCTSRRGAAAGRAARRAARTTLAIAGGGLAVAACPSVDRPVLDATSIGPSGLRTVAFESIDGPPETLFHKLVTQLAKEANARQVAIVSRESPAQYRIRGYVAAHVQGKRTTITWVWDIYDADRERAMRLTGEAPGASPQRAWAAADDGVVTRMARDGMSRLAAFLASPGPAPTEVLPARDEPSPNVASVPGTEGTLAFLPPSRP